MKDLVTAADRASYYRQRGLWTSDTLSSRICDHVAAGLGSSTAVVDQRGSRSRSYADLARDAAAVAASLTRAGAATGDVVSIQLPNCYEAVVAAVAANSLGAVINPLLPNYRARELSHVFRTARPRAIFTPAHYHGFDHRDLVANVCESAGVVPLHVVVDPVESGGDLLFSKMLDEPAAGSLAPGAPASAVSELIFTSGTEATPKAIMHTEETTNFAVRATFSDLGMTPDDVVWMPSPVGHSTGFNYGVRAALYHGNCLVLQDRWDSNDAIDLIHAHNCAYTLAATTFLDDLVSACEHNGTKIPSLRYFGCGGAPVPGPLVERADAVGVRVLRLYGSTEVLCATWNRPDSPAAKRRLTDGRALQHTELEIRDDHDRVLPVDVDGELHVRGPNTSVGFFEDPERTAATYLPDGWVRSGDLAQLDSDGYLSIVGRKKEIIIRGGVNIAPREIEDLISDFPEVRQVAVVGVPDPRLGERGCACVVLDEKKTLSFEVLVERLRAAGLATYKLPERMMILPSLPVTPSGKVQKHVLLKELRDSARVAAGEGIA